MGPAPPAADEAARLLRELRVHQIELRMQNEELRSAQGELEAALARYAGLFDCAPVGFLVVDRRGAIIQLNLAGAALFEKPRAELIGRRLGALLPAVSRRKLEDCLPQVFAGNPPPPCALALSKEPAPRYAQFEVSLDPSGQTCLLALLDITERQRAEAALRVAASVYESLNEGVLITDADNRIVAVNPAFTAITGYPAAEAVGQTRRSTVSSGATCWIPDTGRGNSSIGARAGWSSPSG